MSQHPQLQILLEFGPRGRGGPAVLQATGGHVVGTVTRGDAWDVVRDE